MKENMYKNFFSLDKHISDKGFKEYSEKLISEKGVQSFFYKLDEYFQTMIR